VAGSVVRCELSGFDHEAELQTGERCQMSSVSKAVGCCD